MEEDKRLDTATPATLEDDMRLDAATVEDTRLDTGTMEEDATVEEDTKLNPALEEQKRYSHAIVSMSGCVSEEMESPVPSRPATWKMSFGNIAMYWFGAASALYAAIVKNRVTEERVLMFLLALMWGLIYPAVIVATNRTDTSLHLSKLTKAHSEAVLKWGRFIKFTHLHIKFGLPLVTAITCVLTVTFTYWAHCGEDGAVKALPLWMGSVLGILLPIHTFVMMCFVAKGLLHIFIVLHVMYAPFVEYIDAGHVTDWDVLCAEVQAVNAASARVLSVQEAGAFHFTLPCCGAVVMFACLVCLIVVGIGSPTFYFACIVFVIHINLSFLGLMMLALITAVVTSPGVNAPSILAAARRYPSYKLGSNRSYGNGVRGKQIIMYTPSTLVSEMKGHYAQDMDTGSTVKDSVEENTGMVVKHMTEEEKLAHARFMRYVNGTPLGAELCGVHIKMALVFDCIAKIIVLGPTLVTVIRGNLDNIAWLAEKMWPGIISGMD